MVIDVKPVQPEIKLLGRVSTLSPIVTVVILDLFAKAELYVVQFLAFQSNVVILLQPSKALYSILVTLLPIVTDVKLEQFRKASLPILVTLLGIVTDVILSTYW